MQSQEEGGKGSYRQERKPSRGGTKTKNRDEEKETNKGLYPTLVEKKAGGKTKKRRLSKKGE